MLFLDTSLCFFVVPMSHMDEEIFAGEFASFIHKSIMTFL